MQSQNSIFDDFAKVATGAAGTFAGAAREFETQTREKVREWLGGLDMVGRDEFEAVKAMAARAMAEVEVLKATVAAMERGTAHTGPTVARAAVPDHAPDASAARGGAGPDGHPTA